MRFTLWLSNTLTLVPIAAKSAIALRRRGSSVALTADPARLRSDGGVTETIRSSAENVDVNSFTVKAVESPTLLVRLSVEAVALKSVAPSA